MSTTCVTLTAQPLHAIVQILEVLASFLQASGKDCNHKLTSHTACSSTGAEH